jgi:hypothetical protein
MSASENSVWPNDVVGIPRELERDSPHHLVCFLLSPFVPSEVFDPVHKAVAKACDLCMQSAGIQIECRRADTLHESKAIHDDIWHHIAAADLLVIDVTGLNSNVMFELGVAAAMRRPTQVILIRDAAERSHLPFNMFAQRVLPYSRSIVGDEDFLAGLKNAMTKAITPAPYTPPTAQAATNGLRVDFQHGDRPDIVLSPGVTHRRLIDGCLEFGSFYVFRNSWLLLTAAEYQNVKARVRFRFADLVNGNKPGDAFLGISLRNQHFHANWGHLIHFHADGRVVRTQPTDDLGGCHDVDVGVVPDFDYRTRDFVEMTCTLTDDKLSMEVGSVQTNLPISDMPYVYGAGKVRISTSLCRVQIREIELTPL